MSRTERKRRHDKEVVTVGTLEKGKIVETHENPGQGKRGNGIRFGWASLEGTFTDIIICESTI